MSPDFCAEILEGRCGVKDSERECTYDVLGAEDAGMSGGR